MTIDELSMYVSVYHSPGLAHGGLQERGPGQHGMAWHDGREGRGREAWKGVLR